MSTLQEMSAWDWVWDRDRKREDGYALRFLRNAHFPRLLVDSVAMTK